MVYEPAYTKSKQFITADFPWSHLAIVPLVSQLPAPESSNLDPRLLGAVQPVVTPWVPLSPSTLKAHLKSGIFSLSFYFSCNSSCKVSSITNIA